MELPATLTNTTKFEALYIDTKPANVLHFSQPYATKFGLADRVVISLFLTLTSLDNLVITTSLRAPLENV